jgi:ribosomal protein S18 acetylase RimI-like enzyme
MEGRVDPPSSLARLNLRGLTEETTDETLNIASCEDELIGCAFATPLGDALYVGKVAVHQRFRGRGVVRQLFCAASELGRGMSLPFLELQTRVELVENHQAFAAIGFYQVGESSHQGYYRPRSITMRKAIISTERN